MSPGKLRSELKIVRPAPQRPPEHQGVGSLIDLSPVEHDSSPTEHGTNAMANTTLSILDEPIDGE